MNVLSRVSFGAVAMVFLVDCAHRAPSAAPEPEVPTPALPPPDPGFDVKRYSHVIGWPEGTLPVAPEGFEVTRYAEGFDNPRWTYVLPNGDVLVAEAASLFKDEEDRAEAIETGKVRSQNIGTSANRITLLRDADQDGRPEVREVFLEGLNQPLGMALLGDQLYVANTDGVWRFPYEAGATTLRAPGQKVLDLPAGGYNNHWTRNLLANADGSKLYVSVGSASNNAEYGLKEEERRANILEINPDGSGERIFASGLRNPVGMAWAPGTRTLWTVVNERDNLGEDLVPDYLTHVEEGAFYGWPYAYFGAHEDPRMAGQRPDLVKQTRVPDVALGSHTSSLGLAFYEGQAFPSRYHGGAFIGQHGSWNRRELSGYKVVFVPFRDGRPSGPPEDFLTGFIADEASARVHGRPVGVTVLPEGALLVADDASNTLWRVAAKR
ncbi:PQQ-dependent sugar dehydrogenase [Corallococcus macrosporus]|uniref:L-sorbosone dehydrogenase n=1 Tax=Myxococcus fulvus (strain ATCC BAA-855 / HW-1) TaxID=483219 RepID=F8CD28_MYXFH|nr:sorbosone dehydrogenase family protein [Corallococcus macrosporus]AEI64744.1 l-sorbosone dehydrogenase [Corallococcus macrosporus]